MSPAIGREVVRLAVPAIMTGLLGTAVFLADRMMLARHHGDALASMQLQGPLMWSIGSVFMATCAGTVALVARSTGAGDFVRARAVARASLRIAASLGLAVAVLGSIGLEQLVAFFGPAELALRELSHDYLGITLAALPASFVATSASMILAGSGDTRTPLFAGLLANGTNIALNAVLIYGNDLLHVEPMGVRGAAIGTASAFTIEAIALLYVLGRPRHPLCIAGWLRVRDREAVRDVLRISAPAVAERVLVHAGFLAYAKAITTLGPTAMAANQALITIESICFMCADGFGVAAATVMGQSLGRRDPAGAREGGAIAVGLAAISITTVGVLLWASGDWTLPWFVAPGEDGTALVGAAKSVLPLLAIVQPFMTAGIVLAMGLRGAGDTRSPLVAAIFGGLLVRVGLAWGLTVGLELGLVGIWWASTIDWIVRTIWLVAIFRRGAWTHARV
ncbi:MAG TPA: MATE family efflux transporter [Nannocystaceae bacterium]|nr:MATE family efflux transporter [Nannocystaceae bacterium]